MLMVTSHSSNYATLLAVYSPITSSLSFSASSAKRLSSSSRTVRINADNDTERRLQRNAGALNFMVRRCTEQSKQQQ
jgi:hypothetical protein